MTKFVNPYNFVRSRYDSGQNAPPRTHERIYGDGYTGRLTCILTTVTPITTPSLKSARGGCIYGSSLKGMVRAVAEAMAQACYVFGGAKCSRADRLCMCCRIFGWLKGGQVHMGRVSIGDAGSESGFKTEVRYLAAHSLSTPKKTKKTRHLAFYPENGRKFYYHQLADKANSNSSTNSSSGANRIEVIGAGQEFNFPVDFNDLSGPELGLLLYALQLEEDWYHKLGKGKPLGFGSVKIRVDNILLRPADYYESWDARLLPPQSSQSEAGPEADPETVRTRFIDDCIEEFLQHRFGVSRQQADSIEHWRDLRLMLSCHDDYNVHYPSQEWFDNHKQQQLPTAEAIAASPDNWLPEG